MAQLQLFSTLGCHLCEQARMLFDSLAEAERWDLVEVDIADDPDLMDAYGVRIPVLRDPQSQNEIGWPFDQRQLSQWLADLPLQ